MSSTGNCKNCDIYALAETWLDIFSSIPGKAPATCGESEGGIVSESTMNDIEMTQENRRYEDGRRGRVDYMSMENKGRDMCWE